MGFLTNKRFLIVGIASNKSIAWGIAEAMHKQGAELAFTYQNERLQGRVVKAAEDFGSSAELCFPCDVSNDEEITNVFTQLSKHWDGLDGIIHAVGFAPGNELDGSFVDVATREGFQIAHDISSYSLVALAQAGKEMLYQRQGNILTLTYHASQQTVPNYNVMGLAKASLEAAVRYLAASMGAHGVRVNGISAGPIRTLAASGIKKFRTMLDENANKAPLRRNVTIEEVGNAAAFLCSDLASGISGEILYVDAGANTAFMPAIEE